MKKRQWLNTVVNGDYTMVIQRTVEVSCSRDQLNIHSPSEIKDRTSLLLNCRKKKC